MKTHASNLTAKRYIIFHPRFYPSFTVFLSKVCNYCSSIFPKMKYTGKVSLYLWVYFLCGCDHEKVPWRVCSGTRLGCGSPASGCCGTGLLWHTSPGSGSPRTDSPAAAPVLVWLFWFGHTHQQKLYFYCIYIHIYIYIYIYIFNFSPYLPGLRFNLIYLYTANFRDNFHHKIMEFSFHFLTFSYMLPTSKKRWKKSTF